MDTDQTEHSDVTRGYRIPWFPLMAVMIAVATVLALLSEPGAKALTRMIHSSYFDQMELEKGDIRLSRAGAYIQDQRFRIIVLVNHDIPLNPVAEVDESQFNVDWDIAVVVDGHRVHQAKFKGSPTMALLLADSDAPRFQSIQEYIENNAELSLTITQEEKEILRIDGKPLEELNLKDLSTPKIQPDPKEELMATPLGGVRFVRLSP